MYHKICYKEIKKVVVTVDNYGHCSTREYGVRPGPYLGKDAYYESTNSSDDVKYRLSYDTCTPQAGQGHIIHIEKHARTPRALLRNSDYKIVLDPDKANYIVVPFPGENITSNTFNVAVLNDTTLWMFTINLSYGATLNPTTIDNVKKAVAYRVQMDNPDYICMDDLAEMNMYFLRKSDFYLEMLNRKRPTFVSQFCGYIYDTAINLTPTNTIDLENLELLKRCNDRDIVQKTILGSNWKDYPLTLCTLLYQRGERTTSFNAFKVVLETIHYETFWCYDAKWQHNPVVSPEDWNLCQKWLMRCWGVDEEKGGVIAYEPPRYGGEADIRKYVRRRTMVKPYFITEPTPYSELMKVAEI